MCGAPVSVGPNLTPRRLYPWASASRERLPVAAGQRVWERGRRDRAPPARYSSTRRSSQMKNGPTRPRASRPILDGGAVDPFPDPVPTHSERLRPARGYGAADVLAKVRRHAPPERKEPRGMPHLPPRPRQFSPLAAERTPTQKAGLTTPKRSALATHVGAAAVFAFRVADGDCVPRVGRCEGER